MIEKITDQNLERYDFRLKEWCDRKFFKKGSYGKYETTEEAGAVAFYPAPNTPLGGKVKFSFKETMPAEGVKGLDNPSIITGVTSVSVTRCGKNLISPRSGFSTQVINDVTFTVNGDGTYTVNGTASGNAYFFIRFTSNGIRIGKGITYTLSGCPSGCGSSSYRLFVGDFQGDSGNGKTFTLKNDTVLNCFIVVTSGYTANNIVFKPQLELGSTATSFEPYSGNDYTIPLNNTYYGGSIDLSTGVMTVTRAGIALDGTEGWYNFREQTDAPGTYRVQIVLQDSGRSVNAGFACSHYTSMHSLSGSSSGPGIYISTLGDFVLFTNYTTLSDLTSWLASQKLNGTPVTATWNIATPYTVQLSPTQILSLTQINKYTPRINTVYTDADSVQISYFKSPIRDEYEKTQAILSLGGNS